MTEYVCGEAGELWTNDDFLVVEWMSGWKNERVDDLGVLGEWIMRSEVIFKSTQILQHKFQTAE
jgi:hypothetical protein